MPEKDAAAHQIALTTRAFGQALTRHHAERTIPATKLRRFLSSDERERTKEVERRIRMAIGVPDALGDAHARVDEVIAIGALTGTPLATPYYQGQFVVVF